MVFKSLTLRIEEEQDLVRDGCPGEHHDKASQTAKTSEDDPEDPRNVNKAPHARLDQHIDDDILLTKVRFLCEPNFS